ncbi:hypothetical protein [Streptomyces ambofaciens]
MRMTESFATTVAAVAPVVWLVGAVEYHQVAKRMKDGFEEGERLLAETKAELERASDAEVLAFEWTEQQRRTLRGRRELVPVFMVWSVITGSLLIAMIFALHWLAVGDEKNAASAEVTFCLASLVGSFALVSVMPVAAAQRQTDRVNKRRAVLRKEIGQLKKAARERSSS